VAALDMVHRQEVVAMVESEVVAMVESEVELMVELEVVVTVTLEVEVINCVNTFKQGYLVQQLSC
jgi:hypothetical protein